MSYDHQLFTNEHTVLKNGLPTIGLLLASLASPFHEGILRGASKAAKEKGYNLITFAGGPYNSPHNDAHPRQQLFELVDTSILDGLIITGSSHSRYITVEETNQFLKSFSDVPLVNIGGIYEDVVNIVADYEHGFDEIFNHYVNVHGFKKIAFFRGPKNHMTSERRMNIYIEMLKRYGLPYDESLVVYGDLNQNSANYYVEEFFDHRQVDCDAIITINDRSTIAIMKVLKKRGIRIPEDIAISGSMGIVDGLFTEPRLTTIKEPLRELGIVAVNTLDDLLKAKPVEPTIYVPTELIIRQSCGCETHQQLDEIAMSIREKSSGQDGGPLNQSVMAAIKGYCLGEVGPHLSHTTNQELARLFDLLESEIKGKTEGPFIESLSTYMKAQLTHDDITLWLSIGAAFQYSLIQYYSEDHRPINVQRILEKLIVLIEEVQHRAILFRQYVSDYYLDFINDIVNTLSTSFDVRTIRKYAVNILGSSECYISIVKEGEYGNYARNLLAVHKTMHIDVDDQNKDFNAKRLIPQSVTTYEDRFNLVVFPLSSRKEFLGIMVLDYNFEKGTAYENMQSIISSTLLNELQIQELKDAEARFSDIAHSTSDWLWETNRKDEFIYCSASVEDVIGYSTEQILGKSLNDIALPGKREYLDKIRKRKSISNVEFFSQDKLGNYVYLLMSATPIYNGSKIDGYRGVFKNVTQQRLQEERIKSLAFYDILTGLPNRTMFQEKLSLAIEESKNQEGKFALLYLDLDRFKNVNDTLGHSAGDLLLQKVADLLKRSVGPDNTIARLGGDEFTIILDTIDSEQDVLKVVKRIYEITKPALRIEARDIYVKLSIGVAIYPADGTEATSLLKNSDTAMYRAKSQGRSRCVFHDPSFEEKHIDRIKLENNLYHAIEENRFCLEYQPQIDVQTGQISGVEALVRIKKEDGRLVYPNDFIPIAEELDLIGWIDLQVLEIVCDQLVEWKKSSIPSVKVSVNLSPTQLQDRQLVEKYLKVVSKYDINPSHIQIEITENALIENEAMALEILLGFKACGFRIALDDFGVGHSSLKSISLFPIDTVKIDRMFIQGSLNNMKSVGVLKTIVFMAKNLEMEVIAEGVEIEAQYALVKSLECHQIQGYYFSKPKDVKIINQMLLGEIGFDHQENWHKLDK